MKRLSLARDGQHSHQPPSTLLRHTANIASVWACWLPGERRPRPATPHAVLGGRSVSGERRLRPATPHAVLGGRSASGERRPRPATPHAVLGGRSVSAALEDSACSAAVSLRLLAPTPTGECWVTTVRGWITPASCRLTSELVLKWHL